MNVLTLLGSARKKGNTATALGWVEDALTGMGHDVTRVFLHGKNLNGCMGCAQCKQVISAPGCIQKDDIPEILDQMTAADLIVFASPLYFWGPSAQIKAVIDRTYSLYTRYHETDHSSLLEGRREAFLMTGAGGWDNNAEGAFAAFKRMQKPHKTQYAGELFLANCTVPAEMTDHTKEKTLSFARQIGV